MKYNKKQVNYKDLCSTCFQICKKKKKIKSKNYNEI
jgi:hypothetical protein